jgi:hypothetical protein
LVIAAVAVKEGRDAWRGDTCCASPLSSAAARAATDVCTDGCCTNVR